MSWLHGTPNSCSPSLLLGARPPCQCLQKKTFSFVIDCSKPVDDKIMEIGEQQPGRVRGERSSSSGERQSSGRLAAAWGHAPRAYETPARSLRAILRAASFQKFLTDKIKVDGRPGMLGDSIKVGAEKSKVTITSDIHLSKRYVGEGVHPGMGAAGRGLGVVFMRGAPKDPARHHLGGKPCNGREMCCPANWYQCQACFGRGLSIYSGVRAYLSIMLKYMHAHPGDTLFFSRAWMTIPSIHAFLQGPNVSMWRWLQ